MGDIKADRPLLQPDIDENRTSMDPVELTAELVQGIEHSDRRKAYRGPGAEAAVFPSQFQATVADDQLIVARSSQPLTAIRAALGANRRPDSGKGRKSTHSRRRGKTASR
jgi:hypothetical protein